MDTQFKLNKALYFDCDQMFDKILNRIKVSASLEFKPNTRGQELVQCNSFFFILVCI